MFNINSRKSAIFMALLVLLSAGAAGFAMAAAPSVDSETTTTSQTSEITNGSTQTYNATTASNLSWSADSTNSKVIVEQGNRTIFSASPDPYNTTTGTSYYNVSLADDGSSYSGLSADANEDVKLNVTFINNTEASSPDKTNISFTFANSDEEAFANVEDSDTPSDDGILSSLGLGGSDDESQAKSEKEIGINNNTETVNVHISNSDMSDALTATMDAAGEDAPAFLGSASVDGQTVFLFSEGADLPDWVTDEDFTYATVSDDGEMLTLHNANDQIDSTDVEGLDVTVTGNEAMGLSQAYGAMTGYYDLSRTSAIQKSIGALDLNGDPDWSSDE